MRNGPPEEPTRLQEDQREREDAPDYYYERQFEELTGAFYVCGRTIRVPEGREPPETCPTCGARRLE